MVNLKRYVPVSYPLHNGELEVTMQEWKDGKYVKFSDVEALLSASDNISRDAIEALRALVMEINAYNKRNHLHTTEFIKESLGLEHARKVLQQHPC